MTDDDNILAAELALGLLDAREEALLQARIDQDAAFAACVAWWREQLTPLVNEIEVAPDAHVWPRIAGGLPSNDHILRQIQRWRTIAISAMAVAASLLLVIVMKPMPASQSPQVIMAARLDGQAGTAATVAYEARSGQLTVVPGRFDTSTHDAELWIIPDGGAPVSLGVIDARRPTHPSVVTDRRPLIQAGASFAITLEPKGGSPTGHPTGPVVGAGKIAAT